MIKFKESLNIGDNEIEYFGKILDIDFLNKKYIFYWYKLIFSIKFNFIFHYVHNQWMRVVSKYVSIFLSKKKIKKKFSWCENQSNHLNL